jgi:CubicO group peptidase (beta-lactamase class C family)
MATPKETGLRFQLETVVARFMADESIPGAVIAYGRAGTDPTVFALGHADPVSQAPMSADLRLRLASLSKPITAAAVLELVSSGTLDLDDRLSDILSEVATAPDTRHRDITVRHLLQHTAGWDREQDIDPLFVPMEVCPDFRPDQVTEGGSIARAMLQRPLQANPGTAQAYSNLGYVWLQEIVTQVAGMPYEQFVQERLLFPFGIRSLQLGERGVSASEMAIHYQAAGHRISRMPRDEASQAQLLMLGAAGGWIGTARDFFRFAARPLPRESMTPPPFVPKEKDYYGLGWRVWPERDGPILTHAGFMRGVFSMVVRFPDDLIVVTLFNGGVSDGPAALKRLLKQLKEVVTETAY